MTEQSKLIDRMYQKARMIGNLRRFSQVNELWSNVKKQEIGTGKQRKPQG